MIEGIPSLVILEVDYVAHWKETDYVAEGRQRHDP
jgi:hypothetical protein